MTNDDTIKRAALDMLRKGIVNQSELAELSGRSRQIISFWAKEFPDARAEYLEKQWQRALIRARSVS